jgi:hypothetical protein
MSTETSTPVLGLIGGLGVGATVCNTNRWMNAVVINLTAPPQFLHQNTP